MFRRKTKMGRLRKHLKKHAGKYIAGTLGLGTLGILAHNNLNLRRSLGAHKAWVDYGDEKFNLLDKWNKLPTEERLAYRRKYTH